MNGLFVSASDTGAGKTRIACQLLRAAAARGLTVRARKPVESGCVEEAGVLLAADGRALARASGEDEQRVTPRRLRTALAPDQAARQEGRRLYLEELEQAATAGIGAEDFLIVEGAGGFCSPLAEDGLNADLARRLGLPLVIVIADRLGAINQALLTLRAAEGEGLTVRALVLNEVEPGAALPGNAGDLRQRLDLPVLCCPHAGEIADYPASLFD